MRILVQVTVTTMLRHFTDVLLELATRGHDVRIAVSDKRTDLPLPIALKDHSRISFTLCPGRRGDAWAERSIELRMIRDYLRYLEPAFKDADKLRSRARRKTIKALTNGRKGHVSAHCPHCRARIADDDLVRTIFPEGSSGLDALADCLALIEDTLPSDRAIAAFLEEERPDALLVTPLIKIGSYQAEYVRSAKALGIPVGFPVFSWDNLSTKGLIHLVPDRVYVWNARQKQEAVELHRVDAGQVVVTGAPRFDRFFEMKPEIGREAFCASLGFDPRRPILTYLCSSEFIADNETAFVARWIDEIRTDPTLAECNIAIRPHPRQKGQWKGFALERPRVAVTFPESISTDQSLFDTVYHSVAVVGLNTSAQLEAGIVGRPVFTILVPEFAGGQEGTLHFKYLLKEHGGFVEVASDFDVHRCHLADAVTGKYDADTIKSFIEEFLRPHGRERAVSPMMADAIEDLARLRQEQQLDPQDLATRAWRRVRSPLAWLRQRTAGPT
jgi:hypothetical protein